MQHERLKSSQDRFDFSAVIPKCSPFVKWAGGKTQLFPELDKRIPSHFDRYFEPFLGGGAFFFHLASEKQLRFTAYLSDVNDELITAYKVVKNDVERLVELLRIHAREYKKDRYEYYYKLRAEIKPLHDVEKAARFITLNKTCYNGLYRVNKNGMFNVPIGNYKNPLICDTDNLRSVSLALRHSNAHLLVSDYKEILQDAQQDDFVYLDPPYKPTSATASFTSYTNAGFRDADQQELYEVFRRLDRKGCKLLLSNSDTSFIRQLYAGYEDGIVEVNALRAINCKGSKRAGHKELLISNYTS
jgi:DNA adenine methylase